MLFIQFGINSTRDVWKFCQIGLAPAVRPILAKFPNITRTIKPKLYSQSHDNLYLSAKLTQLTMHAFRLLFSSVETSTLPYHIQTTDS